MTYAMIGRGAFHIALGARLEVIIGEQYRGPGTFSRYGELWLGPLNEYGLLPGVYTDPCHTFIQCDDGVERLIEGSCLKPMEESVQKGLFTEPLLVESGFKYIGDLPYADHLWPGDRVEIVEAREQGFGDCAILALRIHPLRPLIYDVHIEGLPRTISHTIRHDQIDGVTAKAVIGGRNAQWLYEDPSRLRFSSDREELQFWIQSGVSKRHRNNGNMTLWSCGLQFRSGDADLIAPDANGGYSLYTLHEIFVGRTARVRALIERMYGSAIATAIQAGKARRASMILE